MNQKWTYPEEEKLLELAAKHGSKTAVAESLSIPRRTFSDYLDRNKLTEKFEAACVSSVVKGTAPDDSVLQDKLAMLKQENTELHTALRAHNKEDIRAARVCASIEAAVEGKEPRFTPKKVTINHKEKHTLVLLWSDVHAGEVVSSVETNGANEYNWEIMLKRHDELRRGVFSFGDRWGPIEEIVVCGVGDMCSGNIHDELAETNEMNLSEVIVQFGLDGAEFVESLTELAPVRFAGVVGNHGRRHAKPRAKGKHDNADWLSYQIMKQRLSKNKHIDFLVPKEQRYPVMVYDKRLLLLHGEGVRSTMVGVPWGGIIRFADKLSNQYATMGMPIDHYVMGHWHQPNIVSDRKILVNGSMIGINEYSMDRHAGGAQPSQLLLPFNRKWGLAGVHYVDLSA